jgi:hypothetical protein
VTRSACREAMVREKGRWGSEAAEGLRKRTEKEYAILAGPEAKAAFDCRSGTAGGGGGGGFDTGEAVGGG